MKILKLQPAVLCAVVVAISLLGAQAEARVTRIEITTREIVADGMAFGDTGPYEKLRGTVHFEVDPNDPRNAVVFDLDKAPRNARGLVEFSADFFILKPLELAKGNGELFFEVNNRGNKNSWRLMNDTPANANRNNPSVPGDFGNGFLLRQGFTLAWVGWEADVLPESDRLTVQFPIATDHGKPIVERILVEFVDAKSAAPEDVFTLPLSGNPSFKSYEAVSTDPGIAMAELRSRPSDSPRPSGPDIPDGDVVPTNQWSFATCPDGPPGTPSTTDICLAGGFRDDLVYQLKYKAVNPPVTGLGYVTTRDFVSFLHHTTEDDAGNPSPVPGLTTVIGAGFSSSGMYMRDFLYQGFNENEDGRPVFDGVHIHVPGAHTLFLNYRFAQPNPYSAQHRQRYVPEFNFPRTYGLRKDPLTGETDGILKRPATDPKVIHTVSSLEYWQFRASLVDTDEDGTTDIDQPDNTRRYLFSSVQHGTDKGAPPNKGIRNQQCQQFSNPTHAGVLARALVVALDKWVRDGSEPPDSRVPRIDDGTLVASDQESTGFPDIPAGPTWDRVNYNGLFNASGEQDFGTGVWGKRGVIDDDHLTPGVLSVHQVLVPKVDAIGNDIAGIRHPFVEAPIATLTGWNLRTPAFTDGDLCDLNGMMIPLRQTRQERLESGDARPSLEELYDDHPGYVLAVARAALNLWAQRLMLLDDVFETIQEADRSDVLR